MFGLKRFAHWLKMGWKAVYTSKVPPKHIEVSLVGCHSRKEAKIRAENMYERRIKPEHGHMLTQVEYDNDTDGNRKTPEERAQEAADELEEAEEKKTAELAAHPDTGEPPRNKKHVKLLSKQDKLEMKTYTLDIPKIEKL